MRGPADLDAEWEELRIFLAAWEARSFSKAAGVLGVGQATVSRRIAALEERVGHPVFERSQGGLIPTPAGELLHPYAEAMATSAREAAAALHGFEVAPEGDVRLALPPGVAIDVLPPALPTLLRRHPGLRVEIIVDESGRRWRDVDIAVATTPPETGDLLVRRVIDVPFGIFASASYVRSLGPRVRLRQLDLIGWSGEGADIAPARWMREHATRPAVVSANNTLALAALARQGLGAVVFPDVLAAGAGLVRVPVKASGLPSIAFYLVVHRALRKVPRIAVVVDFILEVVDQVRAKSPARGPAAR